MKIFHCPVRHTVHAIATVELIFAVAQTEDTGDQAMAGKIWDLGMRPDSSCDY